MGQIIGLKSLEEMHKKAIRLSDQKGMSAELEVANKLKEYLPADTYIISQPKIGSLQPDFLVISPQYGFRLIEVKNFRLDYIDAVLSNGVLKTRYKNINPIGQVQSHVEALRNFLLSNFKSIFPDDIYREIGYCVIHIGFTQETFGKKFNQTIGQWSQREQQDFFKHHLFGDQLNRSIESLLKKATKFPYHKHSLKPSDIHAIVESIQISDTYKDNLDYVELKQEQDQVRQYVSDEFEKMKKELESLRNEKAQGTGNDKEIAALKNEWEDYKNQQSKETQPPQKKNKSFMGIIALGAAIAIGAFIFFINTETPETVQDTDQAQEQTKESPVKISDFENRIGDTVEIDGKVEHFFYHSDSGTKFLTLSDASDSVEAVIFRDTEVPFVNEGSTYSFKGYIQETPDGSSVELVITGIN